jgi:Opacity protein and related surface antigens
MFRLHPLILATLIALLLAKGWAQAEETVEARAWDERWTIHSQHQTFLPGPGYHAIQSQAPRSEPVLFPRPDAAALRGAERPPLARFAAQAEPLRLASADEATPTSSNRSQGGLFGLAYLRGYLGFGVGIALPLERDFSSGFKLDSDAELLVGSVGVDLSRYISFEIAFNLYELGLDQSGVGRIGEYALYSMIPQLRLRYPLLNERLVPYLVGGAGIGFSEFNDPRPAAGQPPVLGTKTESSLVGSLGAGIEYFLAPNLAVGLESKYLFHNSMVERDGANIDVNIDSWLLTGGLRIFFPEASPASMFEGVRWPVVDKYGVRPYITLRLGKRIFADRSFTSGFELGITGGEQLNGGSIGVNLNKYLGVELAIEYHDMHINADTGFKVAEYAIWNFIPQLKLRYPLLNGDLVPYVVGGVGLGVAEVNDPTFRNTPAFGPVVSGRDLSFVGAMGLGIDYFLADNLALMAEAKYVNQHSEVDIDGMGREVNVSAYLFSAGLRVYFR